mgnify:CR=1 FL=1
MTARVAFKKKKKVAERVVWMKTMHRLGLELYGKNSKSEKQIIIREILSKKFISHSNLSLDEHKKQN